MTVMRPTTSLKVRKGCALWDLAHIRRHYETAQEENKSQAEYVLAKIQELYRIEQAADIQGISPEM